MEFELLHFTAQAPEIMQAEEDFISAILDKFVMNVTALILTWTARWLSIIKTSYAFLPGKTRLPNLAAPFISPWKNYSEKCRLASRTSLHRLMN